MKNSQKFESLTQRKKKKKWLWILLGILGSIVIVCLGIILIGLITTGMSTDTSEYGYTTQQNPVAMGTSANAGDLKIWLTDVSTTNKSQDNRYYTLDGCRVIIEGMVMCELPADKTCTFQDLQAHLILPEGTLFISTSGNRSVEEIDGGDTEEFRFESTGWIQNNTETSGTLMKLEFKEDGFLDLHTVWFDLGWE